MGIRAVQAGALTGAIDFVAHALAVRMDIDLTTEPLDDPLGECEAHPGSRVLRAVQPLEHPKGGLDMPRLDSDAVVGNLKFETTIRIVGSANPDFAAAIGEFECVVNQIPKDLLEPDRVSANVIFFCLELGGDVQFFLGNAGSRDRERFPHANVRGWPAWVTGTAHPASKDLVAAFWDRCLAGTGIPPDDLAPKVLPESFTGKAISYAQNQWDYLIRYTSNGLAPIDNNLLERDIRPFVTGRKSWLFSDTVAGAKASAVTCGKTALRTQ